MNGLLYRHAYLPHVTLGRLYVGDLILPTLEEGWRPDPDGPGGQRREPGKPESCIPDGTYTVIPHRRPNGSEVWALANIDLGVYHRNTEKPEGQTWGRSEILIHRGNTTAEILGCILVGLRFGHLNGMDAVLESGEAIARLSSVLGHTETHTITIGPTLGTTQSGVP